MKPICFIDTETTGLHLDRQPWEIALIIRDAAGERECSIQVEDVDLTTAEQKGLQIGGFYARHAAYGGVPYHGTVELPEYRAAAAVEAITRGAHLVGAVPSFDAECLAAMLRRHGMTPAWHYHLIDIESMAAGWLIAKGSRNHRTDGKGPVLDLPWRSDELSLACGVQPPTEEERHTAIGDARWVRRWYDTLVGEQA